MTAATTSNTARRTGARSDRSRAANTALRAGAAVLLADLAGQAVRALRDPFGTDFVGAFRVAGVMLRSGDTHLYDLGEQHAVIWRIYHLVPAPGAHGWYTYLPPFAWVMQPFALLSPQDGLLLLTVLSFAALAAAGVLSSALAGRRALTLAVVVFGVASLPGAQTLALGQVDAFLLCAVAASALLAERGRGFAAGLVLGLVWLKPQLVWLCAPLLLAAGAWSILAGLAAAGVAWAVGSLLLLPLGDLAQWPRQVFPAHVNEASLTVGVPGAVATALGDRAAFVSAVVFLALTCAAAWRRRAVLRDDPALCVGLGVAASLALSPHVLSYNLLLLAVPAVQWTRRSGAAAPLLWLCAVDAAYVADLLLPAPLRHVEAAATLAFTLLLLRDSIAPATRAAAEPAAAAGR